VVLRSIYMKNFRSNLSSILLDLGPASSGPLYDRLARALRDAIHGSRLPAGSALPPSRVLAAELGCSRWVVTEAYAQLAAAGYVTGKIGSGTRVRMPDAARTRAPDGMRDRGPDHPTRAGRPARPDQPARPEPAVARIDMLPGLPDLRAFPAARWAAAIRSAATTLSGSDLGYPDPAGHLALREILAEYLVRARGAQVDPQHLTICGSATEGIGRVCRALRRAGRQAVAVEDPGWPRVREVARTADLTIVPVPVDEQGMRTDLIESVGARDVGAVIVTPAHQFPAGVVLSAERRVVLLDWARRSSGLIIEDDYDAEYRYDRRPVTTMQGTAPDHVALLGSVSKTLSPALGIGWVASPPAWTAALREAPSAPPPVLDQLAFAAFLRAGSYDRHLRAARHRYRNRRDALVQALGVRIPDAEVSGVAAGLHLLLSIGAVARTTAEDVRDRALELGVRVAALDRYLCGDVTGTSSLVLGYGNLADHHVAEGAAQLAAAVYG
jgi:GntR family transcriptional regulator/MocR family aminotransferase